MWRHIASNALTLLIVFAFLLGGMILWGQRQYVAEGPLEEQICLRVERGSNVARVSRKLEAEGAVTSGTIFRLGMDYGDKSDQLKAGSYRIPVAASMAEISEIVIKGVSNCGTEVIYNIGVAQMQVIIRDLDPATNDYVELAKFAPASEEAPVAMQTALADAGTRYSVRVVPGVTSWQVREGLVQVGLLEGELAEVPPEGMLAPDSYEIRKGDDRATLLQEMQAAQEVRLAAAWESRDRTVPLASPEEALVLASIIEKETGVPDERRQVASVFVNRLKQGMRLQTDPTVIYGVTEGRGVLGRGLRQSELRGETPYNTYVIDGLPPGPIANPSRASLEAAVNPDETDYIFFVADGTGGHAFAITLEEHNANVRKWREIEAQRSGD
ncbi:endolytic transglycosylase MltG [Marimonas arenosa]|uniref:Endolytic murein transglycosylase n=1 Tax=Marimonas arenosa TaxID=1795305 RepID=A0AAE4B391_9RHOB|nr:endolytic transglycosylase MltG [Marimonas arenosa]MDQ2089047.1 endolytic transglycosylase MltG [Marimonas arenosa]